MYQFQLPPDLYGGLVSQLPALEWRRTADDTRSMCGVRDNVAFAPLIEWIDARIADVFDEIYSEPTTDALHVCAAWVNRSERGEYTAHHSHPWSTISGIIYLTGDNGNTTFMQNNAYDSKHYMMIDRKHTEVTECPIANGTMVMFPSALEHLVPQNESDTVRHTLSWNALPRKLNWDETVQFG